MKPTTLAVLAALIGTSALLGIAFAQQTTLPAPLEQLGYFVGDGTCTGHVIATGKTPARATTARFHGEKTLDGNWVAIHYDEDQTAANPKPYRVVQYFGYDAAKKQYTSVTFDNSGSGYSTGTSSGWKDDTFTVDETTSMRGGSVSFRDVFTKSGSGMASHTGMMRDKHGKWVKTDEETCH